MRRHTTPGTAPGGPPWAGGARRRDAVVAAVAFGVPLAVMVVVALSYESQLGTLTNDPVEIAGLPTRYGAIANASLALWGAAAAVSLLGAAAARRLGRAGPARWLVCGAAVSLVLLVDDMLLLHDEVLEERGIPERATLLALAAVVVLLAWWNRAAVLGTNAVLLAATCGCFGVWAVSGGALFEGGAYLQDAAKLAGICGWLAYFSLAAYDAGAPPPVGPGGSAGAGEPPAVATVRDPAWSGPEPDGRRR